MMNRTARGIVILVLLTQGLAGCDGHRASVPSAPSPVLEPAPPSVNALVVFTEQASGFSTSDLRDAHDHIVQFSTRHELIWAADGTRLPGYTPEGHAISADGSCQCWLIVRFGTANGERRAYLTADYGHDNPGTLIDLAIVGRALSVSRTDIFAPGTYTLSGVITEPTDTGQAPVQNAGVWRLNEEQTGWQVGTTDGNGFYEIRGLYDGSRDVEVSKEGYETVRSVVSIHGDTRFDIALVRR